MKIIDEAYRCNVQNQILGNWKLQCCLYICFSHPEQQTVIISNPCLESGQFASFLIDRLVEHIIKDFKLNPDITLWIEHHTGSCDQSKKTLFTHITFQRMGKRIQNLQRKLIDHKQAQFISGERLEFLVPSCKPKHQRVCE
jgi:hypothetical protein